VIDDGWPAKPALREADQNSEKSYNAEWTRLIAFLAAEAPK
jgi:hypothetical protein